MDVTMKVLYVSDLDGTLLNSNEEVDLSIIEPINELIDKGINFTISTGRGDSIRRILKDINLKLPVMILNGAVNYDFTKKQYVDAKPIPSEKVLEIINNLSCFDFKTFEIQTIINNNLRRFAVSSWNKKSNCLALNLLVDEERTAKLSEILSQIKGINFFINKKVYSDKEWYCDIIPENISKASSLRAIKEQYGFDKVIAFGDSENDLPLAEVADEFYAVANAADIVKQNATGIIGSCLDNGVVKFIMENSKSKDGID